MLRLNQKIWKAATSSAPINSTGVVFPNAFYTKMFLKTSCVVYKDDIDDPAKIKAEKKKKSLHITLIGTDGRPSTSTMEAANKLSKRRDLRLVKISDCDRKTQNPVFKLLSSAQILGEEIQLKKQNKGKSSGYKSEKILSFSYKITEHDIQSKVKQIFKLLEKNHEVRVTITGAADNSLAESVFGKIEKELKYNGRILQKRLTGSDIKFTVIPPKEETVKPEDSNLAKKESDSDQKNISSSQLG